MGSPEPSQDVNPRADPLDDVFGSDGGSDHYDSSPVFEGEGEAEGEGEHHDHDHDGNLHIHRPGRGAGAGAGAGAATRDHPSDIHRLRQEHTTAGYREGITVAKASSIQAGFDEGFGLGATIGLRVGYLLGVLEGIAAALPSRSPAAGTDYEVAVQAAGRLLSEVRTELGVQSVFSPEYWHADGTWKYEVVGHQERGDGGDEEVLFSHVAEAHPLVRKWTSIVEGEMRKWGVEEQLALLQRSEEEEEEAVETVARVKPAVQTQPDAKAASDALSW